MSIPTLPRWEKSGDVSENQWSVVKREPPTNKLSDEEQRHILDACNKPEYAHLSPCQIVSLLADNEIYLASDLHAGTADKGSLLGIDKSVSTGFAYYGLDGKSNAFGAAANWADAGVKDDQITLEAFYLIKIMPYWELTPDIQIVQNPANNPDEN